MNMLMKSAMTNNDQKTCHPRDLKNRLILFPKLSMAGRFITVQHKDNQKVGITCCGVRKNQRSARTGPGEGPVRAFLAILLVWVPSMDLYEH